MWFDKSCIQHFSCIYADILHKPLKCTYTRENSSSHLIDMFAPWQIFVNVNSNCTFKLVSSGVHPRYGRGQAIMQVFNIQQLQKKKAEEKEKVFKPRPQGNVGCFKSVFCCQTITPLNCSLIFIRHLYRTILILLVFKKAQGKTTFPSKCLLA